jgi:regulatory protein
MGLLARREYSQFELRARLKARGYTDDLINDVLSELSKENLQSDTRFTENYLRMRVNRGFGPRRIQAELREHGIAEELINEFVDENDAMWSSLAKMVLKKKFGDEPPRDFKSRAKQLRFLQYRGFSAPRAMN